MKRRPDGGALEQAIEMHRAGDLAGARVLYEKILKTFPKHADALHLLGLIKLKERNHAEAIRLIRRAVAIAPSNALYHAHLAEAYRKSGDNRLAEGECRLALRCDPKISEANNLLGLIRLDANDPEGAGECFSAAIDAAGSGPACRDAMLNLSAALLRTGDYRMAAQFAGLVLKLTPNNPLAWTNLGMAQRGMGKFAEAMEAFRNAGAFPMARFNLGYSYLLQDDLARGLPLCEERKRLLGIGRGLQKPEWDGEPMPARRLLVIPEQGMGDTILMSRFYPMLLDRFAAVTVVVQKPLARLIETIAPGIEVVTDATDVRYDVWCATMSLPFLLGCDSVAKIPNEPWLHVPAPAIRPNGKPRIGINWAGNPSFAYDAIRSTHLESLAMLLDVRDVEWCSLHKGHLEHEAEELGIPQPLNSAGDFYETAVVIRGLDLVVSTETAIPNLSAALGVPTCVLTSPDPDWRWGAWYPSARVCAQESPGNWYGPIAKTLEAIRDILVAAPGAAA